MPFLKSIKARMAKRVTVHEDFFGPTLDLTGRNYNRVKEITIEGDTSQLRSIAVKGHDVKIRGFKNKRGQKIMVTYPDGSEHALRNYTYTTDRWDGKGKPPGARRRNRNLEVPFEDSNKQVACYDFAMLELEAGAIQDARKKIDPRQSISRAERRAGMIGTDQ